LLCALGRSECIIIPRNLARCHVANELGEFHRVRGAFRLLGFHALMLARIRVAITACGNQTDPLPVSEVSCRQGPRDLAGQHAWGFRGLEDCQGSVISTHLQFAKFLDSRFPQLLSASQDIAMVNDHRDRASYPSQVFDRAAAVSVARACRDSLELLWAG
jgi:hypothetical protein